MTEIKDSGEREGEIIEKFKKGILSINWKSIENLIDYCQDGNIVKYISNSNGYFVSNKGKVFSVRSGKWLKPIEDKYGYHVVNIYYGYPPKIKQKKIHRLVAKYFIDNPNNYEIINHKDEDKKNNHYKNLEWCNIQYSNTYGSRLNKVSNSHKKKVYEYNLDGCFLNEYLCAEEVANKYGVHVNTIRATCNKRQRSSCGKIFRYFKTDLIKPLTEKQKKDARRYL